MKKYYEFSEWDFLIKKLPNRSKYTISSEASKLGLHRKNIKNSKYTPEEDDILKKYYATYGAEYIVNNFLLNRSIDSVTSRAVKLKITSSREWENYEIEIMLKYYEILTIDEMMELLPKRTRNSIINTDSKLKLKNKTNREFSYEEKLFIKSNFLNLSDEEIGNILGRTKNSISRQRCIMKLKRPNNYIVNSLSEFIRKHNYNWKIESMKNSNFKCIITGERFSAIHHLYGFNLILKDTLSSLGYDDNVNIKHISESEKYEILKKFYEEQKKHPLGVCLTKELHMKFHNIYGYGDNTPEQFNEFMNNI